MLWFRNTERIKVHQQNFKKRSFKNRYFGKKVVYFILKYSEFKSDFTPFSKLHCRSIVFSCFILDCKLVVMLQPEDRREDQWMIKIILLIMITAMRSDGCPGREIKITLSCSHGRHRRLRDKGMFCVKSIFVSLNVVVSPSWCLLTLNCPCCCQQILPAHEIESTQNKIIRRKENITQEK